MSAIHLKGTVLFWTNNLTAIEYILRLFNVHVTCTPVLEYHLLLVSSQ